MKLSRKVFAASALMLLAGFAFAQSEKETSVESEYLNDVDGDIIMTLAESDEYDNKLVALQYLQSALDDGNTSDAVIQALDRLAGDGLTTQNRTNGRLMNNFPEIRREACKLMAKVPTEHTKNQLINIMVAEDEPMVLSAAVQSLGIINPENTDEVIEAIAFVNKRNMVLNPTSSLAFEVIEAFEKLSPNASNHKQMTNTLTQIYSNYRYNSTVRNKAQQLLKKLSNTGSSSNSKNADAK